MSKIYEALRRAELDRAAADGKQPETAEPTTPAPTAVEPGPDPEVFPIAAQPEPPPAPSAPAPVEPPPFAASPTPFASASARFAAESAPEVTPPTPVVAQPAPVAVQPPPVVQPAPFAAEHTPLIEPAPFVPESMPFAATRIPGSNLNMASVARHRWTPSFHHLPALETRGRAVEQFRSLRSRMHEFRDLNTLKSILVTSGLPQEGKTFIAANLAISFARHKAARVLLIDGDMRRSSLHHLLGCPSEPGLTEYLSGEASIMDIMQRSQAGDGGVLHHGLDTLTFIPAGKDSDKAADLSGNYRFGELITAVSPMFDWIVVDSSPVNLVADGVNLSRACDGVLVVARAGLTKYEVAQRALTELKASNILGFVLNAVVKPSSSGGYYGYEGYDSYDSLEE